MSVGHLSSLQQHYIYVDGTDRLARHHFLLVLGRKLKSCGLMPIILSSSVHSPVSTVIIVKNLIYTVIPAPLFHPPPSTPARPLSLHPATRSAGRKRAGFKWQLRRCRVTVLGKLFTPIVPLFIEQQNLVAALSRVAGVTAGLAESNGSLPPGL